MCVKLQQIKQGSNDRTIKWGGGGNVFFECVVFFGKTSKTSIIA
jgi:hypothetical protein